MKDDWDGDGRLEEDDPSRPQIAREGQLRRRAIGPGVLAVVVILGATVVMGAFSGLTAGSGAPSQPPEAAIAPTSTTERLAAVTDAPPVVASPSPAVANPVATSPTPSPTPSLADERRTVPLNSVTDGDTIRVIIDGVSEPVRIIGLDSPELRAPGTPVECMALEATAAAHRLLDAAASVRLESDPTQDTRDRFGRILAHVFLPDGRLFSEEMIRMGYAIHYVYDGIPSVYADQLAEAERRAKESDLGLWDPATCAGDAHTPAGA